MQKIRGDCSSSCLVPHLGLFFPAMGAGVLLGDAAGLGAHPAVRRRRTRLYLRNWASKPLRPSVWLGVAACVSQNRDRRGHVTRFSASASSGSDEPGELSEDEAQREWEAELNRRLKEAEEMEELERTAEQLQSQAAAEAPEESEEEKRERVRRELQKVLLLPLTFSNQSSPSFTHSLVIHFTRQFFLTKHKYQYYTLLLQVPHVLYHL